MVVAKNRAPDVWNSFRCHPRLRMCPRVDRVSTVCLSTSVKSLRSAGCRHLRRASSSSELQQCNGVSTHFFPTLRALEYSTQRPRRWPGQFTASPGVSNCGRSYTKSSHETRDPLHRNDMHRAGCGAVLSLHTLRSIVSTTLMALRRQPRGLRDPLDVAVALLIARHIHSARHSQVHRTAVCPRRLPSRATLLRRSALCSKISSLFAASSSPAGYMPTSRAATPRKPPF